MVKKVLIAEDEPSISKALAAKLIKDNFDVTVASNGHDALEILKKEKFDVLLLDLIMPRLDGFNTLEEIRSQEIDVKVIIVSNLGQKEDVEKVKEMGVLEYFVKSDTPLSEIVTYLKKL